MKSSSPTFPVHLTRYLPAVVVWLALAILTVPRCSAQVRGTLELSPVVGIYLPSAQSVVVPSGFLCPKGALCPNATAPDHPHSAFGFGGRMTTWVNKGVAVEGSLWYSQGFVTDLTTGARGSVLASDVRVLVSTRGTGTWAYVAAGPAIVGRFDDAYAASGGAAHLGGVVGVGAHLHVARSLALRAEVENYLYSLRGHRHQDFSVSVGLSVASRIGSAPKAVAGEEP